MNGFFEALEEQTVTITLAGQEVTIPRARLGLHLRLGRLSDAFEDAPGPAEMAEAIQGYFEALGLDIGKVRPVEILRAFIELRALNGWQMSLAFMKDMGAPAQTPEPYDYPDRNWAWIIHKLASRYGWTREEIFNLYPEEAAVYLQEILISEHFEEEARYRLSELAYSYDTSTGRSHYRPMDKPPWMYSQELPKPVKILKSMLPFGVVDLEGKEVAYH